MLPLVIVAACLGLALVGVFLLSVPVGFITAGLLGASAAALFIDVDKFKGGDA